MTTDLEKQFFDTFGIEPKPIYSELWADEWVKDEYPQITDRILLELICIAIQHEDYPTTTNMKNIQTRTLKILLRTKKIYNYYGYAKQHKKLVKQVRTLFEEER